MTSEPTDAKGRPTPKRKEVEAARKQGLSVPKNSKDARKAARERQRQASLDARAGLMRGEEKYFPAKDRGPVRKAVRDWVDSRRTVGEYFVPMAFIVILSGFVRNKSLALFMQNVWLVMLVLLIIDCIYIGFRINLVMKREFPDKKERKGVTAYAIMRAIQIRRFRIPPATVRPGGKPVTPKKK